MRYVPQLWYHTPYMLLVCQYNHMLWFVYSKYTPNWRNENTPSPHDIVYKANTYFTLCIRYCVCFMLLRKLKERRADLKRTILAWRRGWLIIIEENEQNRPKYANPSTMTQYSHGAEGLRKAFNIYWLVIAVRLNISKAEDLHVLSVYCYYGNLQWTTTDRPTGIIGTALK